MASFRKFIGDWHVRVWQGKIDDRANATTWPMPVGSWWGTLRERLNTACHAGSDVTLSHTEAMALRDVVSAYMSLPSAPSWRLKLIADAMAERLRVEEGYSDDDCG